MFWFTRTKAASAVVMMFFTRNYFEKHETHSRGVCAAVGTDYTSIDKSISSFIRASERE